VPDAASAATALATLRVTVRQAVYLTAADNFAREIRLLARPPGDRSAAGAAVSKGQL
jgi:pilus assembly protein CpaB